MAATYRCSECSAEFAISPRGVIDVSCGCNAPVIAEAVSTLTGSGGIS